MEQNDQQQNHCDRRKLLKKEKRRLKRQTEARRKEEAEMQLKSSPGYLQRLAEEEEEMERLQKKEDEERRKEEELWLAKEKKAQEEFEILRLQQEEDERLQLEKQEREEQETLEKKKRQEELLAQAVPQEPDKKEWCNPPAPIHHASGGEKKPCSFFVKTGACRFGDRCSKHHDKPVISQTLLIPNMFTIIELDQQHLNEADQDMELEYDEREVYYKFVDFYDDVKPAFQDAGHVVQLKVCCNMEPHLRGNVYVQYASEEEASRAFTMFNARWYAQRQLSVQFTSVTNWKAAICGLFHRNRCPKGRHCNFLHVFRNPRNEFSELDSNRGGETNEHRGSRYRTDMSTQRTADSTRRERNNSQDNGMMTGSEISSERFANEETRQRWWQHSSSNYRHDRRGSWSRSENRERRSRLRSREKRSRWSNRERRSRSRSRDREKRSKSGNRERRSWSVDSDDSDIGNSHRHSSRQSRDEARSLSPGRRKRKRSKSRSRDRKRRHGDDSRKRRHGHRQHKKRDSDKQTKDEIEREQDNFQEENADEIDNDSVT